MIQKAPVDHLTGERVDPGRVHSFNEAQLTEEEKRRPNAINLGRYTATKAMKEAEEHVTSVDFVSA